MKKLAQFWSWGNGVAKALGIWGLVIFNTPILWVSEDHLEVLERHFWLSLQAKIKMSFESLQKAVMYLPLSAPWVKIHKGKPQVLLKTALEAVLRAFAPPPSHLQSCYC